ncbi:hypothetical protein HDV04_003325 [Boothiomyces sp. JEL0838]|nr:hypothetical protein HDV04_003325 [Boothiomyces sp. JEL0838]
MQDDLLKVTPIEGRGHRKVVSMAPSTRELNSKRNSVARSSFIAADSPITGHTRAPSALGTQISISPLKLRLSISRKKTIRNSRMKTIFERPKICHNKYWVVSLAFSTICITLISVFGILNADFKGLLYPYDYDGNQCGVTDGFSNMINLYHFNLSTYTSYTECVKDCPIDTSILCRYNVTPSWNSTVLAQQFAQEECVYAIPSMSVMYQCVPQISTAGFNPLDAMKVINTINSANRPSQIVNEIFNGATIIIGVTILSVILATIWFLLLIKIGHSLILASVFVIMTSLLGVTGYLLYAYLTYKLKGVTTGVGIAVIDANLYNQNNLLYATIGLGVLILLVLYFLFYFWKSIQISRKIVIESGKALSKIKFVVLFSFIESVIVLVITATTAIVVVSLYVSVPSATTPTFLVDSFEFFVILFMILILIWYVWVLCVMYTVGITTISSAVGKSYWQKMTGTNISLYNMFIHTVRYQLGSIAKGIIAIPINELVKLIEFAIRPNFGKAELAEAAEKETKVDGFFEQIGRLMKGINPDAFIEMALHGGSFVEAGVIARALLRGNTKSVSAIGTISRYVLWLGVLAVLSADFVLAAVLMDETGITLISNQIIPMVIILGFSLITTYVILGNFGIAVSTILYCYCEDLELNDGSAESPYQMSDSLKHLLHLI